MKKTFAAMIVGALLAAGGLAAVDAYRYHAGATRASANAEPRPLQGFSVDPSWVKSGSPNFRNAETMRSPDGRTVTGLWSCDGPSTFVWTFHSDETVHLVEGLIEIEYLNRRFTLRPGDTATFLAGSQATWHVPRHATKAYTLQQPGRVVRLWRRMFPDEA